MQKFRVVTESLIVGDRVYHRGDIISEDTAGESLRPYANHFWLIQPIENEPVSERQPGAGILRFAVQLKQTLF